MEKSKQIAKILPDDAVNLLVKASEFPLDQHSKKSYRFEEINKAIFKIKKMYPKFFIKENYEY